MFLTNELQDAMNIVCGVCPYINDCMADSELTKLAYPNGQSVDADAKYCDNCMVRNMHNLYAAMDKAKGDLPYTAPEWQAIINY